MNYNQFFGFSESPFLDPPDLNFFLLSQQGASILAELAGFINARRGLAMVSGEDGVGKTMLAQALLAKLPPAFHSLVIARPEPEPMAISVAIAQSLGVTLREKNLVKLTPFAEAVQAAAQQGKYLLVVVDDAHLLTDQHLEEIYVLSQMEQQGRQLIPILLVGGKGLVQKVASKANQRLQALVAHNLVLTCLTFEETSRYIDHRLKNVGSSLPACFADGCSGQIFSRTGGIPRRINQVCDQALTRAWQHNLHRVTRDLLGGEEPPAPFKPLAPPSGLGSRKAFAILGAGLVVAGLAGYFFYQDSTGPAPSQAPPPVAASPAPAAQPLAPPVPEKPEPAATAVPPAPPQAQPVKPPAEPEPPAPLAQASQEPPPREMGVADTSPPPPAEPPARQSPGTGPATHQVTREDGLLKIAATYYPDNKEIGYDAVILANPRITNEDVIFAGQTIVLPKVDKGSKIIALNSNEVFAIFGRYYTASQAAKVGARLKALQLNFVVRETELPDNAREYRVFIGGYGSREELQKAVAEAEKN
jgi:type II secretory pathway predicted ATPase ExeA